MNLAGIFRRENVTIGIEAGKEVGEVIADGKVTLRECIGAGKDIAHTSLEAYGRKDEVLYQPSAVQHQFAGRISAACKSIEARLMVAAEDGITYGEAVDLIAHAATQVGAVITDLDAPIAGGGA